MPRHLKAEDEKLKPRSVPLSNKTWRDLEEAAGKDSSVGSVARKAIELFIQARKKKQQKQQAATVV